MTVHIAGTAAGCRRPSLIHTPRGEIGKRAGFKFRCSTQDVWVRIPPRGPRNKEKNTASIAQLVEQRTFNPWVQGSSPCGGTSAHKQLLNGRGKCPMSINPPVLFSALTVPFNRLAIGAIVENNEGIRYMKTYFSLAYWYFSKIS